MQEEKFFELAVHDREKGFDGEYDSGSSTLSKLSLHYGNVTPRLSFCSLP